MFGRVTSNLKFKVIFQFSAPFDVLGMFEQSYQKHHTPIKKKGFLFLKCFLENTQYTIFQNITKTIPYHELPFQIPSLLLINTYLQHVKPEHTLDKYTF
jgi:hypothetical protein